MDKEYLCLVLVLDRFYRCIWPKLAKKSQPDGKVYPITIPIFNAKSLYNYKSFKPNYKTFYKQKITIALFDICSKQKSEKIFLVHNKVRN